MLKELFEKKQEYLSGFFEHLDIARAESFFHALRNCKGSIVLTGVGKSGLVAEKIALTMVSTGSRAFYLSPINAMHGDLGMLSPQDVFVMLSKSGESDELLRLVPHLRSRGVSLFGIVSSPHSRLSKACDFCMTLPLQQELCPFNMAPTTSTTTQMIFGDVLAIALMRDRKFTLNDYMQNHPGGNIGKRLTVRVKDLMIQAPALPLARPTDKLVDLLVEMSAKCCGCMLVVDEQHGLQGFFTDGDLRRALVKQGSAALEESIGQFMTRSPRTILDSCLAWEAMQRMEEDPKRPITSMPVVDAESKVVGLIKLHDIVQAGI